MDEVDGDLTSNILTGGYVNASVTGTYMITYTVKNSSGNSDFAERTVIVKDTAAPVISLRPPVSLTVFQNERFIDPGAIVEDNCDGIIPVAVLGTVDTSKAGVYTLTYTARDSAGNDAFPLTRRVVVVGIGTEGEGEPGPDEGEPEEGEPVSRIQVPELVLESQEMAGSILAAVSLAEGNIAYKCSKEVPEGFVISQNPTAGALVDAGAKVDLVISTGPCSCGCDGWDTDNLSGVFLGVLAGVILLIVSLFSGGGGIKLF